jgi:hypothetical protein
MVDRSIHNIIIQIFRRWEDCLDLQRTLELEFDAISRRRRKGMPAFNHYAKNTLYPVQRAASFDSLPLGPDPSSIATDLHEYIPRLSKKSTLFKVTQATVTQRGQEFKAMIEALLDEDAHSTIQELRTIPLVRDFFALWRRDKEAERRNSSLTTTAPPIPQDFNGPTISPAANASNASPAINYLNGFLHTPLPTITQKPPKPASRNSYAPSRNNRRPHTANPGETSFQSSRRHVSPPFNTAHDDGHLSDGPPASSRLAAFGPPLRTARSSTVPDLDYEHIRARPGAISDTNSRPREPLLLRSINGTYRAPARQVSTPELPRPHRLEQRHSRDLPSRNVDARVPVSGVTPMPVFMLPQRQISQPGGVRRATLRDPEESTDSPHTPLRSFPFDHPPDSPPVTPGLAGFRIGRAGGTHTIDSLAVLDPEMYHSLSSRQAPTSPLGLPTPTSTDPGQVLPRTRKTPPIIDQGNRSARFFVDDPATGMVDVAGGPPPHSPTTPAASLGTGMSHDDAGHLGQVAVSRQFQAPKLEKPPVRRATPPIKPPSDMSDHEHSYSFSSRSVVSVPGSLSPNASSRSSHGSQQSTNNQKFRARSSLESAAERRLSVDSLIPSDLEFPYLPRRISPSQFSQKNQPVDPVYAALHVLNTPSTAVPTRQRGSYSSQETDSTSGFGLEDNLGTTSSGSPHYAPAWLPVSKATSNSPKSTPPPRPPRSALRNSSQFPAGVVHRFNESLNAHQYLEVPLVEAHDFIDSYFTSSQSQHDTLEPPQSPYTARDPRESTMSSMSALRYYHNAPDRHESFQVTEWDPSVGFLPSSPFTSTFDPTHSGPHGSNYRNQPLNTGAVPIKAVHAQSETIVLFKVPRYETTLADLRAQVLRKFREAEGLDLTGCSLKYLPPRGDHSFISSPTGRRRSPSASSTSDISVLASLDNEADWQRALAGSNKIIIRIV